MEADKFFKFRGSPVIRAKDVGGYTMDVLDVFVKPRESVVVNLGNDASSVLYSMSFAGTPPTVIESVPFFGAPVMGGMLTEEGQGQYRAVAGYLGVTFHIIVLRKRG